MPAHGQFEESLSLAQQLKEGNKRIKELKRKSAAEEPEFLEEASAFFRSEPSEAGKEQRLKYIAIRTDDGRVNGKISFFAWLLKSADRHFMTILTARITVEI